MMAIQVASFTGPTNTRALLPRSDYFLDLLNGAAAAAADFGCALMLTPPNLDALDLAGFAVDGVIMVDPRGDEPLFNAKWQSSRPMVTTGRVTIGTGARSVVDNDHLTAATTVLDHLEREGYQRPALIVTSTSRSYIVDMLDAYRAWAETRGVEQLIVEVGETPSESAAAKALTSLLERSPAPDAIFASSEELALGVLHEAQQRGIDIPGTLGVCSAVDSSTLQLTTPQVTGTMLNPGEIGRQAAKALLELAAEPEGGPHHRTVATTLCERDSTARRGVRARS